jgi:ABC-type hemin transport system ATPase subunit
MISCHELAVGHAGHYRLHPLTLALPPQCIAILGANGAGKSTLLRLLAGEQRPQAGYIDWGCTAMAALAPATLARVRAWLPQSGFPLTGLTVAELLHLSWYASGGRVAARFWDEVIPCFGLEPWLQRTDRQLSGGESQRVHLARLLLQVLQPGPELPRYLLLDEPATAFDAAAQRHCLRQLRQLARAHGIGVIASMHDIQLASHWADSVLCLQAGQMVAIGPPATVLQPELLQGLYGCPFVAVPGPAGPVWIPYDT